MSNHPDTLLRANLESFGPTVAAAVASCAATPRSRAESGPVPTISMGRRDHSRFLLHSSRDPLAEADRLVAPAFLDGPPSTIIVIGLGLGFVLDAIERRAPTTKVLALEPLPDTIGPMLSRRDWRPWLSSGRLTLLIGPHYQGTADAWSLIDDGQPDPPLIAHPVVAREFARDTDHARALALRIVSGARENANARKLFGPRYLINSLTNLARIATEAGVNHLRDRFAGVPAILAAAGPSLDANIAQLRTPGFPGLIVAVDTALRPLTTAGIQPHIVVGVDPSELNGRHLTDLPPCSRTCLVGEGSLASNVLPAWAGRSFVFRVSNHHPWPWIGEHGLDGGGLRAWGSVLTTAFDFALHAGCDPIVFVGADLAYTDDLIYCRNTTFEANWAAEGLRVVFDRHFALHPPIPGIDVHGGTTKTAPHLLHFRDWLVQRATEQPGRQIINATGAGLLHGGAIQQAALGAMRWPGRPADAGRIDAVLARAYRDSRAQRRVAAASLRDMLIDGTTTRFPLENWRRFTGDAVTEEQILHAVSLAASSWQGLPD